MLWKKRKRTTAEKDDDSDVEDDFKDEPEDNDQSDSEELNEKDDEGSVTVNDFPGESFDIGQTIDLESKDLADVLTEKDLLPKKAVTKKIQPRVKARLEEDWEM